MNNKYYDLIVSLVKQHRKYPECASILEDIVADVYQRANFVLTTITDENVLKEYLNKLVSTSIIIMSKKLNLKENSKDSIKTAIIETLNKNSKEDEEETSSYVIENNEEDIVDLNETIEPVDETELNEVEDFCDLDEPSEEEVEEIAMPSNNSEVDITLVDKMINGVSTKSEEDSIVEPIEVETIDFEDEIISLDETTEPAEETELEEVETIDFEDEVISLDETTESAEETELDEVETIDFEDEVISLDETTESAEETELDEVETIDFEDEIISLDETTEPAEETELDEVETIDFEDEIISLDETIKPAEETELEEVEENQVFNKSEIYHACFDFEPKENNLDIDLIQSELLSLDKKYSQKRILEICDLKYNKNLSISQIAEKTSLPIDDIISTLLDVVNAIKD